jgi:transposase
MASLSFSTNPRKKEKSLKQEISEKYLVLKMAEWNTSIIKSELRELRIKESTSKGLKPAYIGSPDLIAIIDDLLLNGSPVSKAFKRLEVSENKCEKWAERTIKYSPNKDELTLAINTLLTKENTQLKLMSDYKTLDMKSIAKSDSYSAGLNKLKKQLITTLMLQNKDDQLAVKDKTISDRDIEITRLKHELLRGKSKDWQHEAIELYKSGVSKAEIAKRLGKGRTTISNHLNKPDIKKLTASI